MIEVDTFSSNDGRDDRMNYRITIKDEGRGRRYYRLIVESYSYTRIGDEIIDPSTSYAFFTDKDPLLEGSSSVWFDEDERNKYHLFTNEVFEGTSYVMKVSNRRMFSYVYEEEKEGQQVVQYNVKGCRVKVVNIDKADLPIPGNRWRCQTGGEGIMEPIQVYGNVKNGVGVVGYANEGVVDFVMPEKGNVLYTN